jgi:hypothetical protein
MSRMRSIFFQVIIIFFVLGASEGAEPVRSDG